MLYIPKYLSHQSESHPSSLGCVLLNNIARATPAVAKIQAKKGIITLSYPVVIMLFRYPSINPQCIPKITNIFHEPPTMRPANNGLKSLTTNINSETIVEPNVASGPITINATGNVSIGTLLFHTEHILF